MCKLLQSISQYVKLSMPLIKLLDYTQNLKNFTTDYSISSKKLSMMFK